MASRFCARPAMWRLAAAAVAALAWPLVASAGEIESKNCILLDDANFDNHLVSEHDQRRPTLIMFHVNWCKVCQRAYPEFVAAADKIAADSNLHISLAHVDCTNDKTLCTRFSVKGYPAIKLFSPDMNVTEPRGYKGSRSQYAFVKYADRMTQPPVRRMKDSKQFVTALQNESFAAFIAAVPEGQNPPEGLAKTAETWMDRHIFAAAPNMQDLLPKGAKPPPAGATLVSISCCQQQWPGAKMGSEPPPAVSYYTGTLDDPIALEAWVAKNRFPGIWMLSETTFYEFTHASRTTAILAADYNATSDGTEKSMRDAVAEFPEDIIFGVVDGVAWAPELKDFNLYPQDLPRVILTQDNLEAWIEDTEALRVPNLVSDLRDFVSGKVSLLRQGHGTTAKVMLYKREAWRWALRLYNYAGTGPTQAASVLALVVVVSLAVVLALYCVFAVFRELLSDPPEPPSLTDAQRAKMDELAKRLADKGAKGKAAETAKSDKKQD
eukprot:gnl/TRDRNA2_/TRDRNA2_85640_c0_seq1.p1 gnl/TRDRNA2_/TRDRNA2_85640_c0~~gnl/TRDRNA2_/TRDRNA2_85640_c0_seq1.p1  ORF type:complete len:494 (-),score=92.85 gnl/TRDRNA2_/TRDRNA2_85640_c0_seq1:219-1700(-)